MSFSKKITDVGFDKKILTQSAQKLTASELIELGIFAAKPDEKSKTEQEILTDFNKLSGISLQITDIRSIEDAFVDFAQNRDAGQHLLTGDACCCCTCTPCCSCCA